LFALLLAGCGAAPAQDHREAVDQFAERTGFNGVILVARGDSILQAKAYGYESVEDDMPTRLETRYQLGSIAKWVTSLVVLKLVDQGRLSLTEPIGSYLPAYRTDAGQQVTLHHLLTNSSGVPNDLVAAYEADLTALDEPLATAEAVRRYASGDPLFEPGRRFDYSHSNWILVQAIVEQGTGTPFEENVRELIVRPLGLEDTGVFWQGSSDAGLAPGYEELEPTPVRVQLPAPKYLIATGGMYSTAPDLLALLNALYGGRVLSDDALEKLDTIYWEDEGYAYGGRVATLELGGETKTVLWHTGSNGPSKTRVSRVLSDGLTVITLTNAGTSPEETGALIERVLESFYR
jgi:D-alanyl-D-alanine carboxypeptidase